MAAEGLPYDSQKKNLFIQAPTGVGKTISTLYPAIKAVGEGLGDKIFLLNCQDCYRKCGKRDPWHFM